MGSNSDDIQHRWEKISLCFKKTGKYVSSKNLEELKKSAKELQQEVEKLNFLLEDNTSPVSTPSTSQKTDLSSSPLKRKRNPSGKLTLQELKESIKFEKPTQPSVAYLQNVKTIDDKVNLLYTWEIEGRRLQVRTSLHSGFYLQHLRSKYSWSVKQLCEHFEKIPERVIYRNLQLYNQLGEYRTVLYSTLPAYKLFQNIEGIKNELSQQPPEEQEWWKFPQTPYASSCFINCYREWFAGEPTTSIFYLCHASLLCAMR